MKKNNTSKFRWAYLAGFFVILALPLLNISPWFSPSSWIQAVLFRSLLAILVFIYLFKEKISLQKIKESFNPHSKLFLPVISLLAYFIAVFISTLTSVDTSFSLWGSPMRGAGFINFAFLIFFCLMVFMVAKDKDWRKLLDFSLIVGFLIGLFSILQQFSVFGSFIVAANMRPPSTLGNPIILALYLLPLLFLSLSFFISEKNPSNPSGQVKKYLYLFLTVFYSFVIIFITQTRAAILGLAVGLFCFLIFYPKTRKAIKIGAVVLPVIFAVFIFFLSASPQIYEKWPSFIKSPTQRMTTLASGLSADPSRISVWKISINAFFEKPYFGYGPENFYIAFNKHYDPTLPEMENLGTFDRAHNYLIQILIDSGIFALIFYLIFFFSLLWQLQKIKQQHPHANGLQAGFMALFIASLASIDGFAIMLVFFLFSAYSLHLISSNSEQAKIIEPKENKFNFIRVPALIILFLILIIFLWQYNFVPVQMNEQLNIAQALETENWQEASKILDEQSKINTFFLPFTNSIYLNLLVDRIIKHPEEEILITEKVKEIDEANTKLQPYDYKNWLRLGESLATEAKGNKDPEIIKKSNAAFQKALELSPKNTAILSSYFMASASLKDFNRAEEQSDYCLKIFPESGKCLWISGLIDIYSNNYTERKDFIEKAKEKGYPVENEISLRQLVAAYIENKDYKEMLPLYQKLSEINPGEVQYKTSLMLVYKELGNYTMARQLAGEIIKSNPALTAQIEAFLKSF